MIDDRSHPWLALSRKQLTLALRTLVMRELVQQRAHLIRQYLRRQGSDEPWGAFLAQADRTRRRVLHELLTHDGTHRRLAQAKAELDGVLSRQAYAEGTAPLFTRELHQTALQLVARRCSFAARQLGHSPDEYSRELWAEQQDYYQELQAALHSQWYDAAVPQSGDRSPVHPAIDTPRSSGVLEEM
jgi:hypothetical protein